VAADLTGCLARLARADECLADFDQASQAWVQAEADKIVHDYDPDTRKYHIVCEKAPVAPLRLTIVIGDAIHSLRSCLDFLVYALAVHESNEEPPPNWNRLAFPAVDNNEADFDRIWAKRLKHLSDEARAEIENLQPFRERPVREADWISSLLVLDQLDNIYKHRRLSVIGMKPGVMRGIGASHPGLQIIGMMPPGPLEDDAVLLACRTDGNPDMKVEYDPAFEVSLDEPDTMPGHPNARELMATLRNDVAAVVSFFAYGLFGVRGDLEIIWGTDAAESG
jgi:hypothetical protein